MTDHVDPRIEPAAIALYVDIDRRDRTPSMWPSVKPRWQESYRRSAIAALAAADKAATITTREQFEALPIGTVVRDCIGQVAERQEDFWANTLSGRDRTAVISFPARVIHWGTE